MGHHYSNWIHSTSILVSIVFVALALSDGFFGKRHGTWPRTHTDVHMHIRMWIYMRTVCMPGILCGHCMTRNYDIVALVMQNTCYVKFMRISSSKTNNFMRNLKIITNIQHTSEHPHARTHTHTHIQIPEEKYILMNTKNLIATSKYARTHST